MYRRQQLLWCFLCCVCSNVGNLFQKRIDDLQSRLNERTIEVNELRSKGVKNGTIPSLEQQGECTRRCIYVEDS